MVLSISLMFQQMCHISQSKAFATRVSAPESSTTDKSNGWEEPMVLCGLECPSGNMTWCEECRDSGRASFGPPEGDETPKSCWTTGSIGWGVVPWQRVKKEGVFWESMHIPVVSVTSMQAKRAPVREQWRLEEKVMGMMGSGGAAGWTAHLPRTGRYWKT